MSNKDRLRGNNMVLNMCITNVNLAKDVAANLPSATVMLQNKIVTPSGSTQEVIADSGYTGLEKVIVEAIPESYIQPSGGLYIDKNGEYDVRSLANVSVSVPTGGSDETFARLIEYHILADTETVYVPDNFCRGWYYITKIDLPNATEIGTYFCYNCENLIEVNIPSCTDLGMYGFYNCNKLASINCENIIAVNGSTFRGCSSLTSLTFLEAFSVGTYGFRACTALERVDFSKLSSIGNNSFLDSSALVTVIIRTDKVCKLTTANSFNGTPIADGTGYIYVPSALVDSYKSASNWSAYAEQIRAIEDFPEITGG